MFSQRLSAQSLWLPFDTIATITNSATMVNGTTRFIDLFNHPIKKNKWWAVSPEAGLFMSEDAGFHFILCKGSNLISETALSTVAVDPLNDRIIYLGTGDPSKWVMGKGLWKSFNGGQTFVQLTLPNCIVTGIDISPINRLWLTVITSQGIYRSTNGGVTFSQINSTAGIAFTDIKRNRGINSHTLYASGFSDFYFSLNDGISWTTTNSGLPFSSSNSFGFGGRIALNDLDTNCVYVLFGANNGSIYKSTNRGLTFIVTKQLLSPNLLANYNDSLLSHRGNYAMSITTDLYNSAKVFVAGENIFSSGDSASSFLQLTNYKTIIPGGIHKMIKSIGDTIRTATDGGIYISTNNGISFIQSSLNSNYFNCAFTAVSAIQKDLILINTPDHGEFYYDGGVYTNIRNPTFSSDCKFSNSKIPTVYYFATGKMLNLATKQEQIIVPGENHFDAIVFSKSDTNIAIITATSGIYRYSRINSAAELIYPSSVTFNEVIICDSSLYAFNNNEMLFTSNLYDSLVSFNLRALPIPFATYHASINNVNSGEMILSSGNMMYISVDNGINWQNFNNGLPSGIEWKSIVQDQYTPGLFFIAGGTNAMYYRKPNEGHWNNFNSGLPSRIPITDLEIYSPSNNEATLYLFYQGTGIFKATFDSLRTLHAAIDAEKRTICRGKTIQFANHSRGAINGIEWHFPGGSPSTSSSTNPTIVYDSLGIFDVMLIAHGINETDTLLLKDYISTLADTILPYDSLDGTNTIIDSIINGGEQYYQWKKVRLNDRHQTCMQFENFLHNEQGEKDILQSTRLKLPTQHAARLLIDVAYSSYDSLNSDTLEVQISTDCGNSYETIYHRSGNKLQTTAAQQSYFTPDSLQWRTDTISLSSFSSSDEVQFRINNIGHYGNNIYLDNMRIDTLFTQTEFALYVRLFIQGLYEGNRKMRPILYNVGISDDPTACDSITIELLNDTLSFQQKALLNCFGECIVQVPIEYADIPVYLKVSHRNAIPVYSKNLISLRKLGYNLFDFSKADNP